MKQCWPEGDLRAYLDGELPSESQQQIGAHLETCGECGALYRELASCAQRVSGLMSLLPEAPAVATPRVLPMRPRPGRKWAVAALSLAAALAIGFVLLPKRNAAPAPVAMVPLPVAPVIVEAPVAKVKTPAAAVRRTVSRKPVLRADFLRLDDEPIETGTIVRIGAQNGDVQADLIVGPDGRAHAIRLVSTR